MSRLTTPQVTEKFKISRFALGRATKSGVLNPLRDNKGVLHYEEEEVAAWLGRKAVRSGSDARTAFAEREIAQARISALEAELKDARHLLEVAEATVKQQAERIEEHRVRADRAEAMADKAEARADRAEERADRAAEDVRALIAAQAKPRRGWWRW